MENWLIVNAVIVFVFALTLSSVSVPLVIKLAIKRMIPSGPLGKKQLSNCKIYAGENHSHEAQQPKKVDFNKFNLKNSKR